MPQTIQKYLEFIANPYPSRLWKISRTIIHWLTIPIKLLIIGGLGYYQIFKHRKDVPRFPVLKEVDNSNISLFSFLTRLPIWKTNIFETYVCRQPSHLEIDGKHHNDDHQCLRNGTYAFLLSQTEEGKALRGENLEKGIRMHIQYPYLARGYKYDPHGLFEYNLKTVSGDMLCGLNLAVLTSDNPSTIDAYERLVDGIIEHDYSLLEGVLPEEGEALRDLYIKEFKRNDYRQEKVKIKSQKAMWQPGLETVGAQALTILATLKLSYFKTKSPEAKLEYKKLFWRYGYGLLSLFPTAYVDKQRGYFNDHNCMISLYVLLKTSESKIERFIYKKAMIYVWKLSKHWYNGYFTGLLLDACPELLEDEYYQSHLRMCLLYLKESSTDEINLLYKPIEHKRVNLTEKEIPPKISSMSEDEFYPEIQHDVKIDTISLQTQYYRTGLGFYAGYIMCLKAYSKLSNKN